MKKATNIILTVFAVGILACLFLGAASLIGYIAAMIIGGEKAPEICLFVFKKYFPIVIRLTSYFTGLGLLGMYLSKQKALTTGSDK